jgi:hypothetical protein
MNLVNCIESYPEEASCRKKFKEIRVTECGLQAVWRQGSLLVVYHKAISMQSLQNQNDTAQRDINASQ